MSVARFLELGMKLTAASIVFLASFKVESGVSLGYVIRTCRSGDSALALSADATRRSAGKTKPFIFIQRVAMHFEVWMFASDVVACIDAGRCPSVSEMSKHAQHGGALDNGHERFEPGR